MPVLRIKAETISNNVIVLGFRFKILEGNMMSGRTELAKIVSGRGDNVREELRGKEERPTKWFGRKIDFLLGRFIANPGDS